EAEPTTLDWSASTTIATREISWHIFEQLYCIDANYIVRPMLAESPPEVLNAGKRYVIHVRRGVKFHDGQVLTANDVVASIKRWQTLSASGKVVLKDQTDVRALDDHTVQMDFRNRFSTLLANMANPTNGLVIIPARIVEAAGSKPLQTEQLIGTGPFQFVSWTPGQNVKLKRFADYVPRKETNWGGLAGRKTAYLDGITFQFVKDQQVRFSGLQTGEYTFVQALSPDTYAQIRKLPEVSIDLIGTSGWSALVFNKSQGPFADVRLRQAVNFAIDRSLVGSAGVGPKEFWELDGAIFFPKQRRLYTLQGTADYKTDVAKAKQLVKESGYHGQPILYMVTKDYSWSYNAAQAIVPQLQAIGLNIDLEVYDWPTLLQRRAQKDKFDIFSTLFSPAIDP
ncbi:MAG: ABC transporter substrate-binding protein, partial [Candidatus Dormibacteria bacterium]